MSIRYILRQLLYLHPSGCLLGICLLLCSFGVSGQSRVQIGGWQVHVPYRLGKDVAEAGDKVYCATEQGLFYYDKEFNTTQTITKVDGLKEQRISAIRYDDATGTLVIGYANTNIDLLRGNRIININDIFRKVITGEKSINHIYIHNRLAYISCSFGVVVLDLVRLEIRDTYGNLGPAGELVNVQATTTHGDSIYIASNLGVLAARFTGGTNLQDFKSWRITNADFPDPAGVTAIAAFGGKLYAGTAAHGIFVRSGPGWQHVESGILTVYSFNAGNGYLAAATPGGVLLLNQNGPVALVSDALLPNPREAVVGASNVLWVADGQRGLVKIELTGANAVNFIPNGPYIGDSFRMYAATGKVYGLSGGFDQSYEQRERSDGFYVYENGEWQNFNLTLYPDPAVFPPVKDLVSAAYNPVTGNMYFGSYGSGLLEWGGLGNATLYNGLNSPLVTASVHQPNDKTQAIRVTDVAVDQQGDVWVVNRNQRDNGPGLHVLRKDKTWESFIMPELVAWSATDRILIDDYNQKWLSVSRRERRITGLYVFDDKTRQTRHLGVGAGAGGLPDGAIYALTLDRNGEVWVGTASGVAVYFNPGAVFTSQSFDAHLPIINRRPLLDGQLVRDIAVDGANRKWMATDNGLWLFSPDGDEQIYHFTTRNSPLPSDKVLSVAVEHQSGEVFVATEEGIASFRAGATVTEGTPDCAVVYPNPVRRDYNGLVGISGLPNNADVRITDISGTLVYKTRALGGTVSWDARSYNGKRVKAGVYLVMSSDRDGRETCISKVAVLE